MGICKFSCYGYGMTEKEAFRNACANARYQYGHQEGYSGTINDVTGGIKVKCITKPKRAKRGKTEYTTSKGAKRWATVFLIEDYRHGTCYQEVTTTQADAIKVAKELADKHNTRLTVRIVKKCSSDTKVAIIHPPKHKLGKWLFSGLSKE